MKPDRPIGSGEFTQPQPLNLDSPPTEDRDTSNPDLDENEDGSDLEGASKPVSPARAPARASAALDVGALADRQQSEVIHDHREDVARVQGVVRELFDELAGAAEEWARLEPTMKALTDVGEAERSDATRREKNTLRAQLDKCLGASLGARATVARTLTAAMKELVTVERIAHGLEADGGEGETDGSILPIAERIALWERKDEIDAAANVTRLEQRKGTWPSKITLAESASSSPASD